MFVGGSQAILRVQELIGQAARSASGDFPSPSARRLGIFEQANGGPVFLDEITEMKPELQPKLLRILEEHKIRRIGGEESIPVNVRVIAATNRPLHEALEGGKLRDD